jgi:hypothetical protein
VPEVVILRVAEVLEDLLAIRMGGILVQPAEQGMPIVGLVPIPVVTAGPDHVFDLETFLTGHSQELGFSCIVGDSPGICRHRSSG